MKKGFAMAILLLSVLLVLPVISGLAAERAETISGVYQPVETEKAEMSTGVYTVYRAGEEEKEKESPFVTYPYTPARPIAVDYPAVTLIEHYPAVEQIEVKKKEGDSIDFGDGYILLIREINPEVGEVLMELQLDDHIIDEKIVRKDESYELAKYNEEPEVIKIVDIEHETTGDYVILVRPLTLVPCMAVPQLNLIISSVPQRADIYIDGQYVGKTQKTIYFVRNSVDYSKMYSLRLVLSGYEDAEQNFQFEPDKAEKDIPITLNRIQLAPTPTLVPQTSSPTPATPTPTPTPTLVPQTSSPAPATPTPAPTLVPHTSSPMPATPAPTLVPQTSSPTPATSTPVIPPTTLVPYTYSPTPTPPGFLAIAVILAILCGYWMSQKRRG
jgi:hypothetical protein